MRTAIALQGRIDTPAKLEAARATRREVENQIESVSDRRNDLVQQRHNADATGNAAVVREHDIQIQSLGGRIRQLEEQKLQLDKAIMEAVSRGVGVEGQPGVPGVPAADVPPVPAPPAPPEIFTSVVPHEPTWLEAHWPRVLGLNVVTLLLMGIIGWRIMRRVGKRADPGAIQSVEKLTQAVDAIAVEVERISENQRYVTKLINDRMLGEGAAPAKPVQTSAKDRVDAR
jgi:hypothetical protein